MTDTRKIRKKCHQCGRVMNSNSVKKHYKDKHKLDVIGNLQFLIKLTNIRLFKTDSYPNFESYPNPDLEVLFHFRQKPD